MALGSVTCLTAYLTGLFLIGICSLGGKLGNYLNLKVLSAYDTFSLEENNYLMDTVIAFMLLQLILFYHIHRLCQGLILGYPQNHGR